MATLNEKHLGSGGDGEREAPRKRALMATGHEIDQVAVHASLLVVAWLQDDKESEAGRAGRAGPAAADTFAMQLPTLSDGRVLLRAMEPGDLPEIEAGIRDPDVIRWIGPQLPTAQEVLLQIAQRRTQGSPTLAICDLNGTLFGKIWLSVSDTEEATGSIGYWLVPAGRGRGLATSAVRLLSTWAADELGFTNLRITCAPDNERSQRVAERSGYLRTSQSADEVVYIKRVVPRPPSSGR